jgi:hypothetical protein
VPELPLSQGLCALVDDVDYAELSRFKWSAAKRGDAFYAVRGIGGRANRRLVYLHRVILNAQHGQDVDHVNGDGLDNRRGNIRIATTAENMHRRDASKQNASGYRGVGFEQRRGKWSAQIKLDRRCYFLGYFNDPLDAARAYDKAAAEMHGEFARLNFPQ